MWMSVDAKIKFDKKLAMLKAMRPIDSGWRRAGEVFLDTAFNIAKIITATANGRVYVAYRTGKLANSLGYTISSYSSGQYEHIRTKGGELKPPTGIPGANPNGIQFALVSTSGYGFWVHQGTSRFPGRPFVTDAFQVVKQLFERYPQEDAQASGGFVSGGGV